MWEKILLKRRYVVIGIGILAIWLGVVFGPGIVSFLGRHEIKSQSEKMPQKIVVDQIEDEKKMFPQEVIFRLADAQWPDGRQGEITSDEALVGLIMSQSLAEDIEAVAVGEMINKIKGDLVNNITSDANNLAKLDKYDPKKSWMDLMVPAKDRLTPEINQVMAQIEWQKIVGKAIIERQLLDVELSPDEQLLVVDNFIKQIKDNNFQNDLPGKLESQVDILRNLLITDPQLQAIIIDRIISIWQGNVENTNESLLAVRVKNNDIVTDVPEENTQWQAGSVLLAVRPMSEMVPGEYTLEVDFNNPVNNQKIVYTQDFYWGVLSLNTEYDWYKPHEKMKLDIGVLDNQGMPVCGAEIDLRVIESATGREDKIEVKNTGECEVFYHGHIIPDYTGEYTLGGAGEYILKLSVKTAAGERMYNILVKVLDNDEAVEQVFRVKRESATRNFPFGETPMNVQLELTRDFSGRMVDVVPSDFILSNLSENGQLSDVDNMKNISWPVNGKAGDIFQFSYNFDAPNVSPMLYSLGPISLYDNNDQVQGMEERYWQLANDITCSWTNGNATGVWNDASNWSGCGGEVPGVGAGVGYDVLIQPTGGGGSDVVLTKVNNNAPGTCDSSGTHDTPCPDGDGRLGIGTSGTGDEVAVAHPSIIYDGGIYKMWYTGRDGDGSGVVRIYHAYSTDGSTWTKYDNTIEAPSNTTGTNGRIPLGEVGSGDDTGVWIPYVINDGGTYKMWYAGSSASSDWRIYMATSTDGGLTWTKVDNSLPADSDTTSTNGRIPWGTAGKGDRQTVHGASVINDGGTYKMWYMAQDTSYIFRVYYATSPDGLTWTKYDNTIPADSDTSSTNGRVPPGLAGSGDDTHAAAPRVVKDGATYKMWYSGGNSSPAFYSYRVFYATSADGLVWTKLDNSVPPNSDTSSTNWRVAYGTSGKGDDNSTDNVSVLIDGTDVRLYYGGNDGSATRIYLADNILTGGGSPDLSLDTNIDIGSLEISGGYSGTVYLNGQTINIGGTLNHAEGTLNAGTSTVIFDGTTTGLVVQTGGAELYDLEFNGVGGDWTLYDSLTVNGTLTTANGTVIQNSQNILAKETVTLADDTFTNGPGGEFRLNGDFNLSGGNNNLGHVYVGNSPDTITLTSDLTVTDLSIADWDSLITDGFDVSVDDFVTIYGEATFNATAGTGGDTSISVGGNWTNYSIFTADTSTVTFTATDAGNTIFSNWSAFNNVVFDGVGGEWILQDDMTVNGDLTIQNGTLDVNGHNLTVSGIFTNNGRLKLNGYEGVSLTNDSDSGIVEYYGVGVDNHLVVGNDYFNLLITGDSGRWATGEMHINNDLIITAGSLSLDGANLTVTGNLDNTAGSSGLINTSWVTFNAPDKDNTIRLSDAQLFNVAFSEERGEWAILDDMYVSNTFEIKSGLFKIGNNVLTVREGFRIYLAGRFQKGESSIVRFSPVDDRPWQDDTYVGQDLGAVQVTGGSGTKTLVPRWGTVKCTSLFVDTDHIVKLLQVELRLTGEGTPISGPGMVDTWTYGENTISYNGGQNNNVLTSGPVSRYDSLNIDSSAGLSMKIGEDDLRSAVIDTTTGYGYFGTSTSPAMIVKVRLSDMTRVGALVLENYGELGGELGSAVIDLVNRKAYFVYNKSPIDVVELDLDTFTYNQIGLTNIGTPPRDAEFSRTTLLDPTGGYLYIASYQSTDHGATTDNMAMLVKVRISDFTVVDHFEFDNDDERIVSGVIDPDNDFGYFATGTNPGMIIKIRLSDMSREDEISLEAGENAPMAAIIDTSGGYAYFGTTSNNEGGDGHNIVKIRLSDFSVVDRVTLPESEFDTAVFDPINNMGYFGTSTYDNYVVQIDLATMTRKDALFITSDAGITTSIIDPPNNFAYFGTSATAGQIYKINLASAFAGSDLVWTKRNNIIPANSDDVSTDGRIPTGTAGNGDSYEVRNNTVIKDGAVYKTWYSGNDGSHYRIYYATSTDGIVWEKYNNDVPADSDTTSDDGRIPLGTDGTGDDSLVASPSVILDGGTYKMWYDASDGANSRIYYAESVDGLNWTKYNNSVPADSDTTGTDGRIPLGTAGSGDDVGVHMPMVILDGGVYKMWYAGNDGSHYRIYYAESADGLTWTKIDNSVPADSNTTSTNGRIPIGTAGRGDDFEVLNPGVLLDGGTYKMWYQASTSGIIKYRNYYATSPDGLTWTKYNNNVPANSDSSSTDGRVPLGSPGRGDQDGTGASLGAATVINDAGTYRMWYTGYDGSRHRIYYATAGSTEMSIDDHLTLMPGENQFGAEVIDAVNGYAYYGTRTKPGVIVKVRLSDFARVDSITLDEGEWNLQTAVIDSTAGYAYFATNTNVGKIIKIRLSDFTKEATLTLNPGEDSLESSVIDTVNGYAYFGTAGYADWIIKIRLSDFSRVGAISTGDDENVSATIDVSRGYAYFTNTTTDRGRVRKVRLSDFTIEDTLVLDEGESSPFRSGIDIINNALYIGTRYNDRKIIKIDLSTFTEVDTMDSGSDIIGGVAIDGAEGYGYFVLMAAPGQLLKIRLSDFTKVGTTTMNNGENWPDSLIIDDNFVYSSMPANASIVVRVPKNGINTFSTGAGEGLIVDNNLTIEGYNVDWNTYDPAITLKGNFYIDNLARWEKSPTQTFTWSPEGTKTFTDLTYDLQDIGFVDETGGHSEVVLLTPIHLTTLHIAAGHIFNLNGYDFTIDSTYTSEGKLKLFGSETVTGFVNDLDSGNVEYYGTGNYTGLHTGNNYYDLIFNGSGGNFTLDNDLLAENDITVTAGTALTDGFEIDLSGTVAIETAGVLNATSGTDGDTTITLAGNWSNSGSYVAGNSVVNFNGTNQRITGETTFYDLLKNEGHDDGIDEILNFGSGLFQKIQHILTLSGRDTDDMIWLRATGPGTQAFIEFDGTMAAVGTVNWLDIQDHAAINSNGAAVSFPINPADSINSGNNLNWFNVASVETASSNVTATVPNLLEFTVLGVNQGDPCLNSGGSASVTSTSTAIYFGIYNSALTRIACQSLIVSTNATNGYIVTVEQDQNLNTGGGGVINPFSGTYSVPTTWASPPGSGTESYFGFTTNDTDYANFQTAKYGSFGANLTPYAVISENGPVLDETNEISYQLEVTDMQESGIYSNNVMYIATPNY